MLAALIAVLEDLWQFVWGGSTTLETKTKQLQAPAKIVQLNTQVSPHSKSAKTPRIDISSRIETAYVCVPRAQCLLSPAEYFDSKVGELFYGQKVQILETVGQYAKVTATACTGWVLLAKLELQASHILPSILPGNVYLADTIETIKLRLVLADEFMGGQAGLPLQSTEFVVYVLKQAGITIPWTNLRPRAAGAWQKNLHGVPGVQIGIEPRTGAVFESTGTEDQQFIAWVTNVAPNNDITISSVGRVVPGECREETFTKEEWIEWRPVFITF